MSPAWTLHIQGEEMTRRRLHWVQEEADNGQPSLRRIALAALSCLALTAISLTPSAAHAAPITEYVSPLGVDSGTCPSTAPCASLQYATSLAGPGTTVYMLSGTYGPQVITATGTSSAQVVVQAVGSVVLSRPAPASQSLQTTPLLQVANSSYVFISGLSVQGMKGRADYIQSAQPYGGEVIQQDHQMLSTGHPATGMGVVYDNLTVAHSNNTCIKLQDGENGVTIQNSTLLDCGQDGNTLDHGIYMTGPSNTVSKNVIAGTPGYGVCAYGTYLYGETIQYNDISGAALAAIIDKGNSARFVGNSLHDNNDGIYPAAHATIVKNVFQRQRYGILFGPSSMSGVVISNNTFYYETGGYDVLNGSTAAGGSFTAQNNIFDGTQTAFQATVLTSGDTINHNNYWISVPPKNDGGSTVKTNPGFIAAPTNLGLTSTSPDVDAGAKNGVPFCGAAPDIGAIETCP